MSGEEKKLQKEIVVLKAKSLPFFAEACDRVGVYDREVFLLSTSLLDVIGFLSVYMSMD